MTELYHGSNHSGLVCLEPRFCEHADRVGLFLTEHFNLAAVYALLPSRRVGVYVDPIISDDKEFIGGHLLVPSLSSLKRVGWVYTIVPPVDLVPYGQGRCFSRSLGQVIKAVEVTQESALEGWEVGESPPHRVLKVSVFMEGA